MSSSRHPDGTPKRLGRYRLERPISSGGMARVFLGWREGIEGVAARVAIKVILPDHAKDPGFRELFINEARIGSLARHANLVQIQDFDCLDDRFFLVMEYVDGLTLRRVTAQCRRQGLPIPPEVIAEVGRQVCDGLHYLHELHDEQGRPHALVHRDVKPSNLIVDPQGVLKLLDYGVAVGGDQKERKVRGTWGYMAPEQAQGRTVGAGADLFALAAVLYELAALEPLFPESEPEELRKLMAADEAARRALKLKVNPALDPLVRVLVRALQRDPDARYPNAAAMGRALAALLPDPLTPRDQLVRLVASCAEAERPQAPPPRAGRADPSADPDRLPLQFGGTERPVLDRRRVRREKAAPARSLVPWLALALPLVAALGWLGWKRGLLHLPVTAVPAPVEAAAVARPVEPPAPTPAPSPAAPEPTPSADPAPTAEATPTADPTAPAAPVVVPTGPALLTISSIPRARLLLDGQFVRHTPLFQHEAAPGPHTITLIAEDGRQTTFPIELSPGTELRKVWDFEHNGWAGP